jgi:hypothetical protein
MAKAVVAQIAAYVPGPITRAHVWLAEAPAGVQQCVWDVVALAALAAMERARTGLRAVAGPAAVGVAAANGTAEAADVEGAPHQAAQAALAAAPAQQEQPPAASGGTVGATVAPPPPIEVAKARAVVDFWQRLRGLAMLGVPQKGWDGVGTDHPILSVVDGDMRCVHPASLELEADDY